MVQGFTKLIFPNLKYVLIPFSWRRHRLIVTVRNGAEAVDVD